LINLFVKNQTCPDIFNFPLQQNRIQAVLGQVQTFEIFSGFVKNSQSSIHTNEIFVMLSLRLREKANAAVRWQRNVIGFVPHGLPDHLFFELDDIHPIGQAGGYICLITIK